MYSKVSYIYVVLFIRSDRCTVKYRISMLFYSYGVTDAKTGSRVFLSNNSSGFQNLPTWMHNHLMACSNTWSNVIIIILTSLGVLSVLLRTLRSELSRCIQRWASASFAASSSNTRSPSTWMSMRQPCSWSRSENISDETNVDVKMLTTHTTMWIHVYLVCKPVSFDLKVFPLDLWEKSEISK